MMWRKTELTVNGRRYQGYCTGAGIEAFRDDGHPPYHRWEVVFSERSWYLNDPPDNDETRQFIRDMEIAVIADAYGEDPDIVRRLTGG